MDRPQERLDAPLDRRRFLQGAGGAAAAAGVASGLTWPVLSAADEDDDRAPLPAPKPIPGGIISGAFHVFGPGDVTLPFTGSPLQGLNVEPSTITDYSGFTAVAFHVGGATDSGGRRYDLETDIRAFKGNYVATDGTRRFGTFAFI
jgi:TAT (twin-arginine translocation) pathway signal sequence